MLAGCRWKSTAKETFYLPWLVACKGNGQVYIADNCNDLHVQGLTDVQISNYLNDKGIKTPKGKKYYYELVWVTRNKSNKRNDRSYERKIELTKLNIYY